MDLEAVFEDAADLSAGQGEDHLIDLLVFGLEIRQIAGLAVRGTMVPSREWCGP